MQVVDLMISLSCKPVAIEDRKVLATTKGGVQ
jgi:hypothetical protein